MWQTLWRALRAESTLARGKRHVIVFAAEQVRGVAGARPWWLRWALPAASSSHLVGPNPALEDPATRPASATRMPPRPRKSSPRIEEAYLNLNARYEIAYQTLSREARELKIRIQCPSGWGETSVAIPARAAG